MDQFDRSNILSNINFLVASTKYDILMNACIQYPPNGNHFFFSNNMKKDIENQYKTIEERHKALFKKITQRGPSAYEILKDILKANNFTSAIDKLNDADQSIRNSIANLPRQLKPISRPKINSNVTSENEELKPLDFVCESTVSNIKKSAQIILTSNIGVYPMTKKKKGVFFLVNITKFEFNVGSERRGSHFDTDKLISLFGELDFYIFKEVDITKDQFLRRLSMILDSKYCQEAQCFAMALMSHGQMKDRKDAYVTFYDNQREEIHNILDNFSNKTCVHLAKKPKIIFFPFCRGESIDIGVPDPSLSDETEQDAALFNTPNLPALSDMLICYGSLPGFVTNREPTEGSWYINALYEVFVNHAHDTHVEDMVKMVGPKIEELYAHIKNGSRQTPIFWNYAFNKHLFFNPGQYTE